MDGNRVVLPNVSWTLFQQILDARGEGRPKVAYLGGTLELMTTSSEHERIAIMISRLLEGYARERRLDLNAFGSWTMKSKRHECGIEADDCYFLGAKQGFPDLAIEIDWSRSSIDKLEIYRDLGVREVWQWRRGRIHVYVLSARKYTETTASALFPDLDLALLATFVGEKSQFAAVDAFRAAIRRKRPVTPRTRPRPPSPRRRGSRRDR